MSNQNVIQLAPTHSGTTHFAERTDPDRFRDNELLLGIAEHAFARIAENIELIRYRAGEVIFEEDDPGDCLFLIADGSVNISKRGRAGQQETLAYLMQRDFFGEMALVDSGKRSAQAAAVGEVLLGRIDRQNWDLLLRLAPHEVMSNFTKSVTRRLRHNNQHFIEQIMRNERLSLIGTTISSIVHDMNNPIACIRGACDVIRGTNQDELTARMGRLIRDAVEKMESMARELIDFTRGNTHLNIESVEVRELLRSLEPDFARCRPSTDVQIDVLYEGALKVDRHRLLRVFGNLIRNAREAMKSEGPNRLRFAVMRADTQVRFEITDTGCGISADLLPRIFEPFVTHGKTNGTGLGLAISKAVVEAHKGVISVRSSERGTTFEIDIPLEA
jgi:signal transduction histidine kinase